MKEITDIKVLADIFYNRTQEDMELNGVYDETDPYTQLVGTICEMLFNQLDVRTANALEEKLFELVYLNEKNNYCAGFRTGVEIAGVICSVSKNIENSQEFVNVLRVVFEEKYRDK
ncbi:MAG: hypothetical protein J6M22_00065 [Firmicutes bacterium]|nr:hypothetical protein [Bacillota bacterium]